MKKKLLIICLLSSCLIVASCGFKPIHKVSSNDRSFGSYTVEITNDVPREINEAVDSIIFSQKDENYKILLNIKEDLSPLIMNTNGTVAKYRIEVNIKYELVQIDIDEVISSGSAMGFAQYDVGASEINNEETRKNMIKIATKNALNIMISRIQSKTSGTNGY